MRWASRLFASAASLPSTLRWIIVVSVLLRVAAALFLGNTVDEMPGVADQLSYHTLAGRVLDGHGFSFEEGWWPATHPGAPTAHWSFLYVGYLSAVYALVGAHPLAARLLQALIVGVLHPLLTWRVSRRLFGQEAAALGAAMVVTGYVYFIYYAGALMTESFYILAILWGFDLALRLGWRGPEASGAPWSLWVQLGLACAAAVLLRQAYLFMLPLLMLWILFAIWRRERLTWSVGPLFRRYVPRALVTTGVVVLMMAPFTVRNYRVFGQFVPLNTNAGFAFFWGNHPIHGHEFLPLLPDSGPTYGDLIPGELRALDEAALDKALLARGIQFVVDDPVRFLDLCRGRIVEYFTFWPTADSGAVSNASRLLSFGLLLPLLCGGLAMSLWKMIQGEGREFHAGAVLLVMVASAYTLMHVLTWALVRYRLPVDAVLAPFAGAALAALLAWARELRWSSRAESHTFSR